MGFLAIKCIYCNKYTGLHIKNTTIEEIITKFVLNAIFHNVGMSWIICSNKKMFYEIGENNHPNWFNKGPCYNTAISSKLHGKLFEDFIRHVITDRYHLLCSVIAHYKKQPSYEEEEISIGDRSIPNNATTETLEALGAAFNFINFWFKLCNHNYEVRWKMYNKDMKMFLKK